MTGVGVGWPQDEAALERAQEVLRTAAAPNWIPAHEPPRAAGCFVCFSRGGAGAGRRGEHAWAAAAAACGPISVVRGRAGAPYRAGALALREGPLLEQAVRGLVPPPDVLLVNATGRDHPRRAGLALHLGCVLGVPTVGVTHRPLLAHGAWPGPARGAHSPLLLDGERVGAWLRTADARRPLAVHAGWRIEPETAVALVLSAARGARTPEPLRRARRAARLARAHDE